MPHNDFELYAIQKQFNLIVPVGIQNGFEYIFEKSKIPKNELIYLDFGCGDGKCFNYIKEAGLITSNIYGIDASKNRIDRCKSIGWQKAQYLSPGEKIPFPNDFFDIISLIEVIEHVPYKSTIFLINELKRIMKKNAFLLLTTPNYPIKRFYDLATAISMKKFARIYDDPTHINLYNYFRLEKLLLNHFKNFKRIDLKNGCLYSKFKNKFLLHKLQYVVQNY